MTGVYRTATNAAGVIEQRLSQMEAGVCQVEAQDYYCVVTKAESVKLPPLSQRLKRKTDGFRLYADDQSIVIQSASPRGVLYGWQEWKRQGQIQAGFFYEDAPDRNFRAVHIDLRYGFPNEQKLREIVDNLVELRYNTLILENENRLPFRKRPELEEEHFTEEELARLEAYAEERYLELIPLQQTLGHLEYALKRPEYAGLREVRRQPSPEEEPLYYPRSTGASHYHDFDEICPCQEEGYRLVEDLLDDTMELFPKSRYIHIGSDEAWNLLYCDDCRKKYAETGKTGLLLEHVNRIAGRVLDAGRTPIIWDDMLRHMTKEELSQLRPGIVIMSWLYADRNPQAAEFLTAFREAGLKVLGAGAAKCSVGTLEALDIPDYAGRIGNANWWSEACDEYDLDGYAMTVWSNYSGTIAPPHPEFDSAWPALAYGARKLWNKNENQADFQADFMKQFFGVDEPLAGLDLNRLLPAAKKAAAEAKAHKDEARMWYLTVTAGIYRLKSQFVIRELYRYRQDITEAERKLLDRRVEEVTRLREWLKPRLEQELRKSYSDRETKLFLSSRFETDEILYQAYRS